MISAIFACTLREAIISVLTEHAAPLRCSLNRADAEKELRARWSRGDHTDTLRDLLKSVQEIARFVTSSFFGKKTKSLWGSKKALSWQHCTHLCYSPLSVWLQQHTHFHTYRNIWTTANQRGVRPSLSLIGLDHDMSLMCLLLNYRENFFFSRTAGRTSATSDFC